MENTINHRVYMLMEFSKLNPNSLSKRIGKESQTTRQILSGRNKPGYEFLSAIINSFESINVEWLMTGRGQMFKQPYTSKETDTKNSGGTENRPNIAPSLDEREKFLLEELKMRDKLIDYLEKEIERLKIDGEKKEVKPKIIKTSP